MKHSTTGAALAAAGLVITVAGCSNAPNGSSSSAASPGSAGVTQSASPATSTTGTAMSTAATTSDSGMHHHAMDGGPAPAGMKTATAPKYPVGTKVTLTADHMEGMKGAAATVVGAYTTSTYAISYTPTTGGPAVTNHEWVVQEELQGVGSTRLADGATATVTADHMPGMKGAQATIDSSTTQTVYLVDYQAGGMTMKNHKWVVESEMTPAS